MPAPRKIATAAVAKARRAWEAGAASDGEIAEALGISKPTFYRRKKTWGWTRDPIERPPVAGPPAGAKPGASPHPAAGGLDPEAFLGEVRQAVERSIVRLDLDFEGDGDGERRARILASLTRTLSTLHGLDQQLRGTPDDAPPDATELRRELARRLEALGREGDDPPLP